MADAVDRIIDAIVDSRETTPEEKDELLKVFFEIHRLWALPERHVTYMNGSHADGLGSHEITFYEDRRVRGGIHVPQTLDKLECPELWQAIGDWMFAGGPLQKVWDAHQKWMEARHQARRNPSEQAPST